MKNNVLKVVAIFLVSMVLIVGNNKIFSVTREYLSSDAPTIGNNIAPLVATTAKIWKTLVIVLQVLAVGTIIFAGIRFIFASADVKADIKKQTSKLLFGSVLVFTTTTVISFLVKIINDII